MINFKNINYYKKNQVKREFQKKSNQFKFNLIQKIIKKTNEITYN